MGRPDPARLSQQERDDLRALLRDYAIALLRVQKKSDFRSHIEGASIVVGVGASLLMPITWPLTVFGGCLFIRNLGEDRAWKRRMRELEKLAQYIQDLL